MQTAGEHQETIPHCNLKNLQLNPTNNTTAYILTASIGFNNY